jgi:hypothetical protein
MAVPGHVVVGHADARVGRLGGDLAAARCLVSMGTAAFDDEYEQVPSSGSTNSVRWNTRLTSSDRTHSPRHLVEPGDGGAP